MRIYQCLNWLTLISRDRSQLGSRGERVRCCDVMGFLISHLNRYSDWTLEELNTFDICKFQSWGNGNRNRSYLNVKIRRYLDKHKFVTAGGVCWPQPLLPRYVMMIDGCPVAGSGLSLPPPSDDLWLSHQHWTFCTHTTGVTSSVTPLTLSWLPIHNLYLAFCFSSEILGYSVLSFSDGFRQLDHCHWRGPEPTDPRLMKPLQRFIPDIKDQSSILSSFPSVLLQVLQVTVYSPPLCFSSVLNQRPQ